MKKAFKAMYDGHQIIVENRWFAGEKLYVDGKLQDENIGFGLRATLNGELKTNNEAKDIKVTIGGYFKVNCKIFVDNALVESDKIRMNA